MSARGSLLYALTLTGAGVCSACGSPAGDPPSMTTPEMREELTRDLHEAEHDLVELQDSIQRYLGDPYASTFRAVIDRWEEYRGEECDALRVTFAPGTIAPVAELTCLIELTDDRREFLGTLYHFARPGGSER